jgi:hypothetical protein
MITPQYQLDNYFCMSAMQYDIKSKKIIEMNFVVIYIILQMSSELPDSQIPDLWLPM